MKKFLKWVGISCAIPLLLITILALLLYVPPIQNWVVKKAAQYASATTGMHITVNHVQLEFPLSLGVDGVRILQQNDSLPQQKDTVADIHHVSVNVQLLPLLQQQVMIDELLISQAHFNTTNLISDIRLQGEIGQLCLQAHGIDLKKDHVNIDKALLSDSRLDIALSDTVPPDSTPSQNLWKISLQQLQVKHTHLALHLPGDTLQVQASLENAEAQRAFFDLQQSAYRVQHLDWHSGSLCYDNNFEVHQPGIDANHIALERLTLKADSFSYADTRLNILIRQANFHEKCGLQIDSLQGGVLLDSTRLVLNSLSLKTPDSYLLADLDMNLNTFADQHPGTLRTTLHGTIGRHDLLTLMPNTPATLKRCWPCYPLQIDCSLKGNLQHVRIAGLTLKLPSAFQINGSGWLTQPLVPKSRKGYLQVDGNAYNISFVNSFLPSNISNTLHIPNGIGAKVGLQINADRYSSNFILTHQGGQLQGRAYFATSAMAYQLQLQAHRFPLQNFIPHQGLSPFTGSLHAEGKGTDMLSPRTHLKAEAQITDLHYGSKRQGYQLNHIHLNASLGGGHLRAQLNSHNQLLQGLLNVDALTNPRRLQATVSADITHADLYHLHLAESPITIALCGHVDIASNLKNAHRVEGFVSNILVNDGGHVYRPDNAYIDILTRRDSTHAIINCADFNLRLNAAHSYEYLLRSGQLLTTELQHQFAHRVIDEQALRHCLPQVTLSLHSGQHNLLIDILKKYGFTYRSATIDLASSPHKGLNGYIHVDSLVDLKDTIRLDTVRLRFDSSNERMRYYAYVRNKEPHFPAFTAKLDGVISQRGTNVMALIYDKDNRLGLRLPLSAEMRSNGLNFHLDGPHPILGYKEFAYNDSNYVFLGNDMRVSAQLKLTANDGQGIQVYTDDTDESALQNLTVSLHKFQLDKVLHVIPYAPRLSGTMEGDFHVVQDAEKRLTVSSVINVNNMIYEGSKMGNVGTELVYMPQPDGSHQVNGILLSGDRQVATIDGNYNSTGKGYLNATMTLMRTPLNYLNGFIPEQIVGFQGYGEGKLDIKGTLSQPDINGEVFLDSSYIESIPYGVKMRFANDPVRITNSQLRFENFEMYANNEEPLNLSGTFDFSNLNRMLLNVRMRARNFQLIDAKENLRSEAYGKAFVNFDGIMTGPLNNLRMYGKVDVLGSTDMSYILRESELTTDNQLEELVKFTDFSDSTHVHVVKPKIEGLGMELGISVDESAHILCVLNADHSNYIDLMGGGDLRMSYAPDGGIQLYGRYTLNNGEMKYSLPIIPLKTFTIEDGSYLEFTGDPYDPILHITATESVKATVNSGSANGRSVDFKCGVKLSKTLNKPGILFIIQAPNDINVQDELNTMSAEAQSKVAITMLVSGMYLADGNTNSFTMNSALSSFLNAEINQIAGSAMRSMGLDIGMTVDNSTTATGALHTDYNFRFAKRLWNNRLNISIGGQLSSGATLEENQNSNSIFFNNVELQYRLDQKSSKYLRLFFNNNTYDWLEGRIGEYGAGFLWRRKLQHFHDIFRLKNDPEEILIPDSTTTYNHTVSNKVSHATK